MPTRFGNGIRTILIGTLVLAMLGVPLANAQMRGRFDDADSNYDGRVTLAEFEAYAKASLASADSPRTRRFHELSPDRQTAILEHRFENMDHGHNGFLDRNDWNG